MSRAVMQQALEALEDINDPYIAKYYETLIPSLRAALAEPEQRQEPEQEPVAKVVLTETLGLPCLQWLDLNRQFDFKGGEYLYTHPAPDDTALLRQALEALENSRPIANEDDAVGLAKLHHAAIKALRERLKEET